MVSVLTAIPGAALIASLVKGAGDNGFDESRLALGLALTLLAIALGIAVAMRVRAPVELSKSDLVDDFKMETVVGTRQTDYQRLLNRIDQMGDKLEGITDPDERLPTERQFEALLTTLRRVHLIATAQELKARSKNPLTIALTLLALAAATWATFNLALAPKTKADATSAATLVDVELTAAGSEKLGCDALKFQGLKIGGGDQDPEVVPLNGVRCDAGALLKLTVAKEKGLATAVEPIEASDKVP